MFSSLSSNNHISRDQEHARALLFTPKAAFGVDTGLERNSFDAQKRPLPQPDLSFFSNAREASEMRKNVLLTQAYLYDAEGPCGFFNWLLRLRESALFSGIDSVNATAPQVSERSMRLVALYDLRAIRPYEKPRAPDGFLAVADLLPVSQQQFWAALDHEADRYGFTEAAALTLAPKERALGSRSLGILCDEPNFAKLTERFQRLCRSHVLFLDRHFKGLPHGEYPHVFQWLYLSWRWQQENPHLSAEALRHQIYQLMDYLNQDTAVGEIVMDWPGQLSPSSPNYINQVARLFFDID